MCFFCCLAVPRSPGASSSCTSSSNQQRHQSCDMMSHDPRPPGPSVLLGINPTANNNPRHPQHLKSPQLRFTYNILLYNQELYNQEASRPFRAPATSACPGSSQGASGLKGKQIKSGKELFIKCFIPLLGPIIALKAEISSRNSSNRLSRPHS
jgi:hypothetical protein